MLGWSGPIDGLKKGSGITGSNATVSGSTGPGCAGSDFQGRFVPLSQIFSHIEFADGLCILLGPNS